MPASKSVLAPFASILSIALIKTVESLDNSETSEASAIVPSCDTSELVENCTIPTFKLLI